MRIMCLLQQEAMHLRKCYAEFPNFTKIKESTIFQNIHTMWYFATELYGATSRRKQQRSHGVYPQRKSEQSREIFPSTSHPSRSSRGNHEASFYDEANRIIIRPHRCLHTTSRARFHDHCQQKLRALSPVLAYHESRRPSDHVPYSYPYSIPFERKLDANAFSIQKAKERGFRPPRALVSLYSTLSFSSRLLQPIVS